MQSLGTDRVISGPMRGLQITAPDDANRQTDKQIDGNSNSFADCTDESIKSV